MQLLPERTRQQIREREQPALWGIECVDVLHGLVESRSSCSVSAYCPLDCRSTRTNENRKCRCSGVGDRQNGLIVKSRCVSPIRHVLPPSHLTTFS